MSLEEAARYLQVAPATLEALANERAIPCTRLDASSGWLFTKALLDEWVAARSRSP
ncbi:MAG: helix-turn-helix domain-containing protein [bacterium]